MPLLIVNLVLPPIVAEMYAQGQRGRLERTLRTFSTLAGIPSLLVLLVFMLLGGSILGLVYGEHLFPPGSLAIHQGAIVLVVLTACCVDIDPQAPCMWEWLSKPFDRTVCTHHAMRVNYTESRC
jgi:Na+-driven multidrug efflux pump